MIRAYYPRVGMFFDQGCHNMPRQEHVFTIFVASPSGLELERGRLEEIIREHNISWATVFGLRLELIQWETHAHPAIGEDPQAVINEQIPNDYDIFIGIMWHRFGTPTTRAGSGTLEEFQNAKKRYDDDPSSVRIMIYFKDAPVPLSEISPEQLTEVNAFRRSLGAEGVLYWTFSDQQQFEQFLRVHLAREVQHALRKLKEDHNLPMADQNGAQRTSVPALMGDHEALGLLELLDITEEAFGELNEVIERISSFSTDFSAKINAHAENIEVAVKASQGSLGRNKAKRLIKPFTDDMDQYVTQVETELPLFGATIERGMNAYIDIIKIYSGFGAADTEKDRLKNGLRDIVSLRDSLVFAEDSTNQFRSNVAVIPPITTAINKSKHSLILVLDRLLQQIQVAQTLAGEAQNIIEDVLPN